MLTWLLQKTERSVLSPHRYLVTAAVFDSIRDNAIYTASAGMCCTLTISQLPYSSVDGTVRAVDITTQSTDEVCSISFLPILQFTRYYSCIT